MSVRGEKLALLSHQSLKLPSRSWCRCSSPPETHLQLMYGEKQSVPECWVEVCYLRQHNSEDYKWLIPVLYKAIRSYTSGYFKLSAHAGRPGTRADNGNEKR